MVDVEEDWDLPTPSTKAPATTSSNSGAHQTLKITDGYKYSYEALASPANIDDWIETPSYGGSRRSNGYGEGRPFRQERNSSNRFDPMKRNDSFSQKSSSFGKSFGTSKPRFSNRPPVPDWDTPDPSTSQMNGSWKPPPVSTPAYASTPAVDEESWDAPAGESSGYKPPPPAVDIPLFNTGMARQIHTPTPQPDPLPAYSPSFSRPNNSSASAVNSSVAEESESWDDDPPANPPVAADIPLFRPSSVPNTPQPTSRAIRTPEPEPEPRPRKSLQASNEYEEETWDDEPSSRPQQPPVEIPIFKPPSSHSSGSNSPVVRAAPAPAPAAAAAAAAADGEENWDDDAPAPVAQEIPTFRPSSRAQDSDGSESSKMTLPKGFGQKGFGGSGSGSGFGGSGDRERDRSWDRGSKGFGGGEHRDRDRGFGGDRRGRGFGHSNDRFGDRDKGFGRSNERGFGNRSNDRGFGGGSNERGYGSRSSERGFGSGSSERGFGSGSSERGFGSGSNERGFGNRSNERGFGGGDREFGREPFNNRHSRGNRHSPYERNGDRGGRSGRGGRGGFRDSGDREWNNKPFGRSLPGGFRDDGGQDRSWGKPFGRSLADRNKNDNGSPSFASPVTSFSAKPAQDIEENWDDDVPSSSAPKPAESRPAEPKPASNSFVPPPIETAPAVSQNDEESWD